MSNSMIMDRWRRHGMLEPQYETKEGWVDRAFANMSSLMQSPTIFMVDDIAKAFLEGGKAEIPFSPGEFIPPFPVTLFECDNVFSSNPGRLGCIAEAHNCDDYDVPHVMGYILVITKDPSKSQAVSVPIAWNLDPYTGEVGVSNDRVDLPEEVAEWLSNPLSVMFITMNLLSCKNVTTEQVLPTRQQRRALQRKGEQPTDERRIIVKVPGKQSHTIAGPRRHGEPEVPAHVVRGHFAEYTPERPLFGKYSGRFWIPAHVRGVGDIDPQPKDYVVKQSV